MSESERGDAVAEITAPYRVRFDECGPEGVARTSALLRYAQDVAWTHSERLGFDRRWYAERRLAWVVRATELAILAPIPLGSTLAVTTRVIGFRKVWARRRTEVHLDHGTLAAWGHTDWVMTDAVRGLPARVPAELPGRFTSAPGAFTPVRVPLPPAPPDAAAHSSRVRRHDLDPMGHVNNAAYLDYLEDALGASADEAALRAIPRRIRIEYLLPAAADAGLLATVWQTAGDEMGGWAWRLADDADHELARGLLLPEGREP